MKDRYGDDAEPGVSLKDIHTTAHNPDCRNGWLGTDSEGRMIPCLMCKPHLRHTLKTNDFGT